MNRFFAALLMLCAVGAYAQDLIPDQNKKGKWGFVDENGKKAVDYKYDEANNFVNGLALVRKGDNFGMIDPNGKEIIPIKYDLIEKHNSYIFRVAAGGKHKDGVLMDEKYGFINDAGKVLLNPEYDEIGIFSDGLAYIKKADKYGYINDQIDVVIPCKYNAIGAYNKQGYVWACEGAGFEKGSTTKFSGGKYGIFDREGKELVPVKYKTVGVFVPYEYHPKKEYLDKLGQHVRTITVESGSHHLLRKNTMPRSVFSKLNENAHGFYASNNSESNKNSVISLDGEIIQKEGKYQTAFYPTDGMMLVIDNKGKYNYINVATGQPLFKKPIALGWAFLDGVAVISRDKNSYELIDTEGNTVSSSYKEIYPRKEGIYIVKSDTDPKYILFGAIDARGKEIIPADHGFVYPPVNGLMACRERDSKTAGYVDLRGNWVIEPTYKTAKSFKHGLADVNTDEGWGLINPSGRQIVKPRWKSTKIRGEFGIDGYLWVTDEDNGDKNDEGYMILKIDEDRLVSTDKYKWCRNFDRDFDGVAMAGQDDSHIGIIDKQGRVLIPMLFNFDQATVAYKYLLATGKSEWEEFDTYKVRLYSNPKRNKARLHHKIESSLWDY